MLSGHCRDFNNDREEDQMNKTMRTSIGFTAAFLMGVVGAASAQDEEHGYACDNCPSNWENLDIESNNCGGSRQSPIAFSFGDARGKDRSRLKVDYGNELVSPEFTLTNIEWGNEASYSTVRFNEQGYVFQQFHFHSTAEHVVNGERSNLEMHFVNKTPDGATLVLAVFIETGDENAAFKPITDNLPGAEDAVVDLRELLPEKLAAFGYTGSTTTPPCSADVDWRMFKMPVELSAEQIAVIQNDIFGINAGFDNNRPIQNREERTITEPKHPRGGPKHPRGDDDDDHRDDHDD